MLRVLKNRNNYDKHSDSELIRIFKKSKNKECIAVLFTRYTHLVFGVCLRYFRDKPAAEDTTMEIFEDLFDKLLVHKVKNFKNWLYSVTRNKCLMIIRKEKTFRDKKSKIYDNFYAKNMENDSEFNLYNDKERTLENKLEKALLMLKNEQQHCIRLMYLENRSYKEISSITGYGLKQVKSYIQNGKRKLRIFLENK